MKKVQVVTDTNSSADGLEFPEYAIVEVTEKFLSRLTMLSGICKEHGLSEVREFNGPDWFGEDNFRIDLHEMCCTSDDVWFNAFIKHSDLPFYSDRLSINMLKEMFAEADDGEVIYSLSSDPIDAEFKHSELAQGQD
jgi:hypothetical protein